MPSLNLDFDYFNHPKTRRLLGLLGRGAAELPVRLWCYCAKYFPDDGCLLSHSPQEVEAILEWSGDPGTAFAALLKVGFLEETPEGPQVHDWRDHAAHITAYHMRGKKMAEARWKDATSNACSNAPSNASCNARAEQNRQNGVALRSGYSNVQSNTTQSKGAPWKCVDCGQTDITKRSPQELPGQWGPNRCLDCFKAHQQP